MYRIEVAETWEQIEEAAQVDKKCIRDTGRNNAKAKLAWDIFSRDGSLLYYLVYDEFKVRGYVRMLRVATQTWVADFMTPTSFRVLVMVAKVIDGVVLAKQFIAGDSELVKSCPRVTVGFPKLDMFPYRIQHATESQYVVVVPMLVVTRELEHLGAGV